MIRNFKYLFYFLTILTNTFSYLHSGTGFEHITVKEGLSNNSVVRILRDRRGFMWFGTLNGLNRYDGKSFNVYKHDPDNPNCLSNNHIQAIYEEKNGNLWIGTYGGGLNKFEWTTEKFTHYRHDPGNNSISSDFVLSIYEDKSGFLWIGTDNGGINKYDRKKNRWLSYQNDPANPNSLSHNIVRAFYEDESGILWIGTDGGGLNKFDKKTEKFTCYKHNPDDLQSLSHNFVLEISEDENETLWLATYGGGVNKFDKDTETFTHYKHDPNNPNSLAHDVVQTIFKSPNESGVIWIATEGGGVDKFEFRNEIFNHFRHNSYNPESLNTDFTFTIYEDMSGLVWVGTSGKGLSKYNKTFEKIIHYKNEPNQPNSLSSNNVLQIFEDSSDLLWIGTNGEGLNKFDEDKGDFTHYVHQPDNINSLSNNKIWAIIEERSGILWIGTQNGLNRFDTKKNKFISYKHNPLNPQSLNNNQIFSLCKDRSDNLWIGTLGGGLNRIVLGNTEITPIFHHYKNDPRNSHSISNNSVICIIEDVDGFLWVGTSAGGLNKFDKKTQSFIRYQHDPHNANSISNNFVTTIYEDRIGVLWIGTFGGGLNRFNPDTENFIRYREKDGLANDIIYGILEDNHHNLWLSTKNGLSKFNPNEVDDIGVALPSAFNNYYIHDGFQDNEFNLTSYFKNSGGEMFFGGLNGFNVFHPDSILENRKIPNIVITEFKVLNEHFKLDSSITTKNKIILPYDKNFFSFRFAALNLTNPKKNQYAYKLEGLDEDWIYSGNFNFAYYTAVQSGEYTFRVKGSNNDGIWNELGTSINIIITPSWWKTNGAYTVYVLLVLSAVYGVWRFQTNRLRMKHQLEIEHLHAEKLEEVNRMKSRFFTNISHEFRTPLTLILEPLNKLLSNDFGNDVKRSLQMMNRNANHLLRLINQLLDFSKLESGSMKLQTNPCDIVSCIKGIMMSFQALAERNHIKYHLIANKKEIELYFDRDKIEKIFYNLLSNAFKFTPLHGEVSVRVKKNSEDENVGTVEISVIDTGMGIDKEQLTHIFDRFYQVDDSSIREQEGSGIGLALIKELVELHHGSVRVQSEINRGSEFTVVLPLGKDHLKEEEIIEEDVFVSRPEISTEGLVNLSIDTAIFKDAEISKANIPIILIVEDNRDMSAYIREYLKPYYKVKETFDGEDGIEKAKEIIPDLVISDIMMPKKDGYELCLNLKQDEKTSHIPIILLTAKAARKDRLEGLEIGADDYLIKPFDSTELLARVKNLIELRRKLRERFSRDGKLPRDEMEINPVDKRFLERATTIIEKYMSNEDFNVKRFAYLIGMSGTQLRRKMNALIGQSPNQFIRTMRLKEAARLIKAEGKAVSEAAFLVGFNSLSYFAKCFKREFGKLPSKS